MTSSVIVTAKLVPTKTNASAAFSHAPTRGSWYDAWLWYSSSNSSACGMQGLPQCGHVGTPSSTGMVSAASPCPSCSAKCPSCKEELLPPLLLRMAELLLPLMLPPLPLPLPPLPLSLLLPLRLLLPLLLLRPLSMTLLLLLFDTSSGGMAVETSWSTVRDSVVAYGHGPSCCPLPPPSPPPASPFVLRPSPPPTPPSSPPPPPPLWEHLYKPARPCTSTRSSPLFHAVCVAW